jgi:dUTP pyrophosphatase
MIIGFKRLPNGEGMDLPSYGSEEAAGMDIRSAEDAFWLMPNQRRVISTGFAASIQKGFELQCRPRSGLAAKNGVTVLNAPGTIDSDYRGEIKVILHNHGQYPLLIEKGDRIAQLVLAPVIRAVVTEVQELDETIRGQGGFGSTGRN